MTPEHGDGMVDHEDVRTRVMALVAADQLANLLMELRRGFAVDVEAEGVMGTVEQAQERLENADFLVDEDGEGKRSSN